LILQVRELNAGYFVVIQALSLVEKSLIAIFAAVVIFGFELLVG
jgi:hypothetical protein